MSRKFDWLLGAAIIAAPLYWVVLVLFFNAGGESTDYPLTPRRVLLLVFLYPVLEEIVFRGALQGWLRKKDWGLQSRLGITTANVLTSIVFAAAHVLQRSSMLATSVFIPGLIFGFFRDRYDNLYAPIALHIFYNSGLIWISFV